LVQPSWARGPPLMAVRAADVAFGDLGDRFSEPTTPNQPPDGVKLVRPVTMIKVQDDEVASSTIDARMRCEVIDHETLKLLAVATHSDPRASGVFLAMHPVVCLAVLGHAHPATAAACASGFLAEREGVDQLQLPASRAPS